MAITIKQFNARVGSLTKSNTKFKNEVQELLCVAAQYAFDDKNVEPLTNLVMRDGAFRFDGIDNKTLIYWIEEHMPARWDNKELKFRYNKGFKGDYDAVTLSAEPWWKKQSKPAEVVSSIDALAEVRALIRKLEKQAEKGVVLEHADVLTNLKTMANAIEYAEEK